MDHDLFSSHDESPSRPSSSPAPPSNIQLQPQSSLPPPTLDATAIDTNQHTDEEHDHSEQAINGSFPLTLKTPNKAAGSPVSSNAETSPQPNSMAYSKSSVGVGVNAMSSTLDKFRKEDLFKLFGKARKENRSLKQNNESLKAKNRDVFKALTACNGQIEVLRNANQNVKQEYDALKMKMSYMQTEHTHAYQQLQDELQNTHRDNDEKVSLIKTQAASYMDEINRLNEQIDKLQKETEALQSDRDAVQTKIGEQYSSFAVQSNTLKETASDLEQRLVDSEQDVALHRQQTDSLQQQLTDANSQIANDKETVRRAETNLSRIASLEEELRVKIRDIHQLQIKARALQQTVEKLTEKCTKQSEKIEHLQSNATQQHSEVQRLRREYDEYKENNRLLNEKLNDLLQENAQKTLKTEEQIEKIESHHLSKYKNLMQKFESLKKRIEVSQKRGNSNSATHASSSSQNQSRYVNHGWKKYHEDPYAHFNENRNTAIDFDANIDMSMDMDKEEEDELLDDLNTAILELSTPHTLLDVKQTHASTSKQLRRYQHQVKSYKATIQSLQTQMFEMQQSLNIAREKNKKYMEQHKRLHKPKNINIDYLRNVLVKFLILAEYLSDEQIILVPVIASILKLSQTEKDVIDNAYNSNRYFMGTNTLFPENAIANSPQKKKKRKKKKETEAKENDEQHDDGDNVANVKGSTQ